MNGLLLGRIQGIPIRVNWSVAVIAALLASSLASTVFPSVIEGRSDGAYWVTAIVTTVAFLASIAAHEYGHALVALRHSVRVESITLWIFGGVAQLGDQPTSPLAALRIAAAGPVVSAAIGVSSVLASAGLSGLPGAATLWLGTMNLLLMGFNLLPAFPLDGGRIYQAWLWRRDGDEVAASVRAARLGRGIGAGLVGLGVVQVAFGGFIGGIWSMAIGWFIREAARIEHIGSITAQPLHEILVSDLMSPDPITVDADLPVETFVKDLLRHGRHSGYPVMRDQEIVGLITLADVPRSTPGTTVGDLAIPIAQIPVIAPDATVSELVRVAANRAVTRTLVMDDGQLVGIVASSDLSRLLGVLELQAAHRH